MNSKVVGDEILVWKRSVPGLSFKWPSQGIVIAILLGFVAVSPAFMISGYVGADEIQVATLSYPMFADFVTSHEIFYRPLTFLLWVHSAREFNQYPAVMHGLLAMLQVANSIVLFNVIKLFVPDRKVARVALPVFCIFPTSVVTFGYVATLADMLVLLFTLLLLLAFYARLEAKGAGRAVASLIAAAALTALGLMSKESAVMMPLAIVLLMIMRRDARGFDMAAVSGFMVCAYFAWRAHAIFAGSSNSPYSLSFDTENLAYTVAVYFLFPFDIREFEGHRVFLDPGLWPVLMSGIAHAALVMLLWRKSSAKVSFVYCVAYVGMIGPVLLTGRLYGYLLYISGAVSSIALASVLTSRERWRRAAGVLLLLIAGYHSGVIYASYIHYGVIFTRLRDTARVALLSLSHSQDDLSRTSLAVLVPNDGPAAAAAAMRLFSHPGIIEGVEVDPGRVMISTNVRELCTKAVAAQGPIIWTRVTRDGFMFVTEKGSGDC